jgi:hypothetical protein
VFCLSLSGTRKLRVHLLELAGCSEDQRFLCYCWQAASMPLKSFDDVPRLFVTDCSNAPVPDWHISDDPVFERTNLRWVSPSALSRAHSNIDKLCATERAGLWLC